MVLYTIAIEYYGFIVIVVSYSRYSTYILSYIATNNYHAYIMNNRV
jgi:hypothetical protein